MPESTNSPWIKAFVLLFAYTFAIPSQLNLNKLSKRQSRTTLALKPRVLLKLRGSHWHHGPPNPLQYPPQPSGPTERHFSCPAQVRTLHPPTALPPTVSMTVSKGIAAANSGTKPRQAVAGIGGRRSLGPHTVSLAKGKLMGAVMLWADPRQDQQRHRYTNTQHWPTCPGSPKVIAPTRSPAPRYPLLAHLPAGLRENKLVELCSNGKYQIINIPDKYFDTKIGIFARFLLPWQHHNPVRECTK